MNWTTAKEILGAVGTLASLAKLGYECASSFLKKSQERPLATFKKNVKSLQVRL
jgi:hypothetical protein